MQSHNRQKQSNAGKSDVRQYEQRFGKAPDEDVKIDVIFALALPFGQNRQGDAFRRLSGTSGRCRIKIRVDGLCRSSATGKHKGKGDKKGKGGDGKHDKKGKDADNAKVTEYFAGCCNVCKAFDHITKDCWRNGTSKSGKNTAFLQATSSTARQNP